jgi:hypothetical protein
VTCPRAVSWGAAGAGVAGVGAWSRSQCEEVVDGDAPGSLAPVLPPGVGQLAGVEAPAHRSSIDASGLGGLGDGEGWSGADLPAVITLGSLVEGLYGALRGRFPGDLAVLTARRAPSIIPAAMASSSLTGSPQSSPGQGAPAD